MKNGLIYLSYCILGLLALTGCSGKPESGEVKAASTKSDPLLVRAARAETRRVERAINVTGSLHPDETVTVSAEVAGRVAAIHADFGQQVRRGEVLAELDKQEFQLQLERSQAALAQALARIGLNPDQAKVTPKSTPAIRQASAQLEDARSKYESAKKLVASGDISRERFTELEKSYRAREAAVEAARDELQTQLASVQALRAEVQLAEKRLQDTVVVAPFDGAVTERLASPGQYMKENTPILRLVKTSPLRLRLDVPEAAAGVLRPGTTLTFTTDAVPGREFRAVVRQLNPSLDARSRTLSAEARLTQGDPSLRPGMFVQVRLVVLRDAEIVVVPKDAVQTVAGLTKVFTIRDGRAVEHRVTPGIQEENWVEVPGDEIRPGDTVAVNQLNVLVDGAEVRLQGSAASGS